MFKAPQNPATDPGLQWALVVHLGAGSHAEERRALYRECVASALSAASSILSGLSGSDEGANASSEENGQSIGDRTFQYSESRLWDLAVSAVCAAVEQLENNPSTNAGCGSNLSLKGTVELDASLMTSDGLWAGVGCVPKVSNPVRIVQDMLQVQHQQRTLSCGRVPPMMLCGEGALLYAIERENLKRYVLPSDASLKSSSSIANFERYQKMLEESELSQRIKNAAPLQSTGILSPPCSAASSFPSVSSASSNSLSSLTTVSSTRSLSVASALSSASSTSSLIAPDGQHSRDVQKSAADSGEHLHLSPTIETAASEGPNCPPDVMMDTVGAVLMLWSPLLSIPIAVSAVSSGGIAMKMPGRVGEAAVYGAGCFAASFPEERTQHHKSRVEEKTARSRKRPRLSPSSTPVDPSKDHDRHAIPGFNEIRVDGGAEVEFDFQEPVNSSSSSSSSSSSVSGSSSSSSSSSSSGSCSSSSGSAIGFVSGIKSANDPSEDDDKDTEDAVLTAVSCSGCGEDIMRYQLAFRVARPHSDLGRILQAMPHVTMERAAGCVRLEYRYGPSENIHRMLISCAHTTRSMVYGWCTSSSPKHVHFRFSKRGEALLPISDSACIVSVDRVKF
eukprot:ANDGO_07583.mRNA.1 Putative threonine aspartase